MRNKKLNCKTIIPVGKDYFNYGFGQDHPFNSKRYEYAYQKLQNRNIHNRDNVTLIESKPVNLDILKLFHTENHINFVKAMSEKGSGYLDKGDTPATQGIFTSSITVVGGVISTIDKIWKGEANHGMCFAGGLHHANSNMSSGFCVFNDASVGIKYLLDILKVNRILYIDIDAHHGDGVFYPYESNPNVWIIDIHQDGKTLFPGTGHNWETGKQDAEGTKLNISLDPNSGDNELKKNINVISDFSRKAKPEIILLQAGGDGLEKDPLTNLNYSLEGHLNICTIIHELAHELCGGKLVVLGGGGYNVDQTTDAWVNIADMLSQNNK